MAQNQPLQQNGCDESPLRQQLVRKFVARRARLASLADPAQLADQIFKTVLPAQARVVVPGLGAKMVHLMELDSESKSQTPSCRLMHGQPNVMGKKECGGTTKTCVLVVRQSPTCSLTHIIEQ